MPDTLSFPGKPIILNKGNLTDLSFKKHDRSIISLFLIHIVVCELLFVDHDWFKYSYRYNFIGTTKLWVDKRVFKTLNNCRSQADVVKLLNPHNKIWYVVTHPIFNGGLA